MIFNRVHSGTRRESTRDAFTQKVAITAPSFICVTPPACLAICMLRQQCAVSARFFFGPKKADTVGFGLLSTFCVANSESGDVSAARHMCCDIGRVAARQPRAKVRLKLQLCGYSVNRGRNVLDTLDFRGGSQFAWQKLA